MGTKILIAEDDADIRGLLRLYLEGEGFEIVEAADGAEALHKAEECSPQLAILDVMMPRMNGFELTKALRRQSDIPILILSAKSQDVDKILGLNLGTDDYVAKPFNPMEIVARVKAGSLSRSRRWNTKFLRFSCAHPAGFSQRCSSTRELRANILRAATSP